jgi:DNA-binding NarL/FixJ family response regulator
MHPIRIIIVEDYKLLRELWTIMFNANPCFSVVETCENGREAIACAKRLKPDIALMDVNMFPVSGIEAAHEIAKTAPYVQVIGLSAFASPRYAKEMLKAGAKGYVTKNSSAQELEEAILQVFAGNKYICKEIKDALCDDVLEEEPGRPGLLTQREVEIVELIKTGMSSKEISDSIHLSVKTVEVHRHNILKKLKLPNIVAVINFVNANGYANY